MTSSSVPLCFYWIILSVSPPPAAYCGALVFAAQPQLSAVTCQDRAPWIIDEEHLQSWVMLVQCASPIARPPCLCVCMCVCLSVSVCGGGVTRETKVEVEILKVWMWSSQTEKRDLCLGIWVADMNSQWSRQQKRWRCLWKQCSPSQTIWSQHGTDTRPASSNQAVWLLRAATLAPLIPPDAYQK